jgi:hypothetical protein
MPAVSSAAELAEAAAADHENDDLSDAPELLSKDDNALAEGTPMPRQTEELRPESTATAVVTATDEDADRQMDLLSSNEVAAADAEVADREGESVDRDSVEEFGIAAEPDADVEDPQPHKRGPLRLIPSDDVDPRTRRRTRGAGRLVPRLGRSVRRQEGRVER